MLEEIKKALYFPLASYFRYFAKLRLQRWKPLIIVVTGSNGKTTLLHLIEAQFGSKAIYTHHANSAYGIPFHILDLHRQSLTFSEWLWFFLKAPFRVFTRLPKQKLYVVEADADRPKEGKFLATLLRPDIVLWVSSGTTHSVNFDYLVSHGEFDSVEEAIAYEYGFFVEYAKKLVVIDGENRLERLQKPRTKVDVSEITKKQLHTYTVDREGTHFVFEEDTFSFPYLLPEIFYVSLGMCRLLCNYLEKPLDKSFSRLQMPPGRGSVFEGISDTILIDSSYNANRVSIEVTLAMFDETSFTKKWVVLGDMLELGNESKRDHERIAAILENADYDRIILVGRLNQKYMSPVLQKNNKVVLYEQAGDALDYIRKNISGGEAILFKGSQSLFLEGIIAQLLKNKNNLEKLPRRGSHWDSKRKYKGL